MLTRRDWLAGVAGAVGLGLAGCGKKAKYRVGVIPKGLTHEFWQSIHRGADRAAADLGAQGLAVEVQWDGPRTENNVSEQIGIIDQKLGAGVNGLVLAPLHSRDLVEPVKRAAQRGVPTVIFDSNLDKKALDQNPDLIVKYVATDNYAGGRLAGQRLLEMLEADGKKAPRLVLFRYKAGSESTEQREQGFIDYVEEQMARQKQAGEPTITWLDRDDGYANAAGATAESAVLGATTMLTRMKDKGIDGIFAVNESATVGLLSVVRGTKFPHPPRIMGFDSSEPLLRSLRGGEVHGLVAQDPYRMGYLGVWHLIQHLEGYNVKADGLVLSTGEHYLTQANMDEPGKRELFNADEQQKRAIALPSYPKRA